MAGKEPPLWQAIRSALKEQGMTVRGLARELAGSDDPARVESQRRKVNKWLDREKPTIPTEKEAVRLAAILRKPDGFFVRQPQRANPRDEIAELKAENARLLRELERFQGQAGSGPGRGRKE